MKVTTLSALALSVTIAACGASAESSLTKDDVNGIVADHMNSCKDSLSLESFSLINFNESTEFNQETGQREKSYVVTFKAHYLLVDNSDMPRCLVGSYSNCLSKEGGNEFYPSPGESMYDRHVPRSLYIDRGRGEIIQTADGWTWSRYKAGC